MFTSFDDALAAFTRVGTVDPARLSEADRIEWLVQLEAAKSWLAAREATGLVATAGAVPDLDARVVGDRGQVVDLAEPECEEIAAALRLSARTVRGRVEHARDLLARLAPVHAALLDGSITVGHARVIAAESAYLPAVMGGDADAAAEETARLLGKALPYARTHTPGQTARYMRRLVAQINPEGSASRRQEAKKQRDVWTREDVDGLSWLYALLPTADATAILAAVQSQADTTADAPGAEGDEPELAGQRRAAALLDLVLRGQTGSETPGSGAIRAHVEVTIPLAAVLGLSEEPGQLRGGAMLGADAARDLISTCSTDSTIRRLVVDDLGTVIDAGRRRYAITGGLRALIAARDQHCRFPGCTTSAARCEVDHATAWDDGGRSDRDNLGLLCTRHHQLKTVGGWQITASHPDGACTWRSPRGRRYDHTPPGQAVDVGRSRSAIETNLHDTYRTHIHATIQRRT